MSAGGMFVQREYRARLTRQDVALIYKARLQRLWKALALNLFACLIVLGSFILLPSLLGITLFPGHYILRVIILAIGVAVAGTLYWKSFRIALNRENR